MNASPETFRRYKLTVGEYRAMGEHGILAPDARTELIDGEIIEMNPIGVTHAGVVDQLNRLLGRVVGDDAIVRVQNPVEMPEHSMPQPDLALLRPRTDFYKRLQPTADDTLLAIEVADSSLRYDRDVKLPLYAAHGIPEAWLIDVNAARLTVHRDPGPDGYRSVAEPVRMDVVAVAGLNVPVVDLSTLFD